MFGMFKRFSQDVAIDLGTANTLVYIKGRGVVVTEPSVVAINRKTNTIVAVGTEAERMYGRTPAHIEAVRPLVDGVVSDFEVAEEMLRYFINLAIPKKSLFSSPRIIVGVPSGITNVQARSVMDAVSHAGAKEVYLIEEPMAAAIGVGLPVTESLGSMIVDIGGGTTDVAVISLSGAVVSKSIKVAGDHLNIAIVQYARDVYQLAIGEKTAEYAKIQVASAFLDDEAASIAIRGRDLATGLPRELYITRRDLSIAIDDSLQVIISGIKEVLELTPPELVSDILHNGMYIAGGGSLIRNLDARIARETGMKVNVSHDPLTAVVHGAGEVLEDLSKYRSVLLGEELQYGEILVAE
jgi:rod shape-determining protein MreB